MKKILLATRPLIPPWDEASKNFAYFLGKSISDHFLTLLGNKTPLPGLPETATVLPIFKNAHFNFLAKVRLFWFLRKERGNFDITHYLFTPTLQNSGLIKKFSLPTTGKTIQTVATLRDDLYTSDELRSILFADSIVVYTDQAKQKLEILGLQNVKRIYPGIDLDLYKLRQKNKELLESFGFTEEHFVVMYPGEYVRLGATDTLTEFCVNFFQKYPQTKIRFVFACRIKNEADAKKKAEVMARIKEAGIEKYVAYSDTVSDVASLYNTADVVVFPAENLSGKFDVPLVIIEAYACSKPVILSDLKAFSEFSDPSFCVTIPTGSSEALAEKVLWLEQNKSEAVALGAHARRFVEENFDLTQTAKEYSELYASL